jgi:hypothetical protein
MDRKCIKCDKIFKYPCRLEKHAKICTKELVTVQCLGSNTKEGKKENNYFCLICKTFFTKYKQSLNRHMKQCLIVQENDSNSENESEPENENDGDLMKIYNTIEKKFLSIVDSRLDKKLDEKLLELKALIVSTRQPVESNNTMISGSAIVNGNNNNTINANFNIATDNIIYPFGCENVELLDESELSIICKDPRKFFINVLVMLYSKKEHYNFTKDNLNESDLKYFDEDTLKLIYVDERLFKEKLKDRLLGLCIIIIYKCKNKLSRKKLIQFMNKIIILDESLNPSKLKNKDNEAEINTAITSTLNTNLRNRLILAKLNVFYDKYNSDDDVKRRVNSELHAIKELKLNALLDYYKNPDEEHKGLSYEEVNTIVESYPKDETNMFRLRRIIRYNQDRQEELDDKEQRTAHLALIGKSLHFPKVNYF